MEMPTRFIFIRKYSEIIKITLLWRLDILTISFIGYKVLEQEKLDLIANSFIDNPASNHVFDSLQCQQNFVRELKFSDAVIYANQLDAFMSSWIGNPIEKEFNLPGLKIVIDYFQASVIHLFVREFVLSYDIFKLMLAPKTVVNEIKPIPEKNELKDITFKKTIENQEPKNKNLESLESLLNMCENNTIEYFLASNLSKNEKNNLTFLKIDKGDKLTITSNMLFDLDLYTYGSTNYKFALRMLGGLDKDNDFYILIMKKLFEICSSITGENKYDWAIIQFSMFVIFICMCKITQSFPVIEVGHRRLISYSEVVNYAMTGLLNKYFNSVVSFKDIEIKFVTTTNDTSVNESIIRNTYLRSLSIERFVSAVFNEPKVNKTRIKPGITEGRQISITKLLSCDNKYSYKNLTTTDFKNKIITKDYMLLLSILVLNKHPVDISDVLRLYCTTISNEIFKEIDKLPTDNMVDTVELLYIIEKHISESASMDVCLDILYNYVIPYLYDVHNIDSFIDYF